MPGLSPVADFTVQHRQSGSTGPEWATTYQMRADGGALDISYAVGTDILRQLCEAEQKLYYNIVTITGGTGRVFIAKGTVPDPTPPPYNPADHIAYTTNLVGLRVPSAEVMFYDQVIDIERVPEYGNIGHIELRGALQETDVTTTLNQRVLTGPAAAAWALLVSNFQTDMETIFTDHEVRVEMVTQSLISTDYFINAQGKPASVKIYGAAQFRPVVSWGLGQVRTDKGHNKYFDHNV